MTSLASLRSQYFVVNKATERADTLVVDESNERTADIDIHHEYSAVHTLRYRDAIAGANVVADL